ncbi:hypothetical protein GCM10010109_41350 [Actinoplanes campanulatus]|nr:hypothetical protein GCM10010109_41350 [Actinoplanes campanulatus]GID39454.1 hypothetical protein Aca09nite_59600 [Actinoplanes campanulatus]
MTCPGRRPDPAGVANRRVTTMGLSAKNLNTSSGGVVISVENPDRRAKGGHRDPATVAGPDQDWMFRPCMTELG